MRWRRRANRMRVDVRRFLPHRVHEDIQVVDLSEQILHLLKTLIPNGRARWQHAFDRVAEALHRDAQLVPRLGLLSAHRTDVQPPQLLIPLEGETLCRGAIRWHKPQPSLKSAGEARPCPLIELLDSPAGSCKRLLFAPFEHPE